MRAWTIRYIIYTLYYNPSTDNRVVTSASADNNYYYFIFCRLFFPLVFDKVHKKRCCQKMRVLVCDPKYNNVTPNKKKKYT